MCFLNWLFTHGNVVLQQAIFSFEMFFFFCRAATNDFHFSEICPSQFLTAQHDI